MNYKEKFDECRKRLGQRQSEFLDIWIRGEKKKLLSIGIDNCGQEFYLFKSPGVMDATPNFEGATEHYNWDVLEFTAPSMTRDEKLIVLLEDAMSDTNVLPVKARLIAALQILRKTNEDTTPNQLFDQTLAAGLEILRKTNEDISDKKRRYHPTYAETYGGGGLLGEDENLSVEDKTIPKQTHDPKEECEI